MLPDPKQIKEMIATALPCESIEVEGDGQHFFATIVSDAFIGKSQMQRHRLVYAALGDKMKADIHALSMKTRTPIEQQNVERQKLGHGEPLHTREDGN